MKQFDFVGFNDDVNSIVVTDEYGDKIYLIGLNEEREMLLERQLDDLLIKLTPIKPNKLKEDVK